MTSFDPEQIDKKLIGMVNRIRLLSQYQELTLDEYLSAEETQLMIERLLEMIIQSSLDVNRIILKRVVRVNRKSRVRSIGNKESFLLLAQYGIIDSDFAELMSQSGSFRNVLAHFYDEIEPERVYKAMKFTLTYYPIYIRHIQSYLNSIETEDNDGPT